MNDCIFCNIVNNKIPCHKVYEDSNFLAFLDINPNTKGVTLVIPKKHFGSSINDIDNNTYINIMSTAKKVAKRLSEKLNVEKVGIAIEGTGVNHFHIKLYPFHIENSNDNLENGNHNAKRIFNEYYQGFLTTQMGPMADNNELKELSEELYFS